MEQDTDRRIGMASAAVQTLYIPVPGGEERFELQRHVDVPTLNYGQSLQMQAAEMGFLCKERWSKELRHQDETQSRVAAPLQ